MSPTPNLVFIFSDRQRFDTLKAYGNDWIRTPHLNALADESVVVRNCYVTMPVCAPARSSIMTGLYPHTAGVPINRVAMLNRRAEVSVRPQVVAAVKEMREGRYREGVTLLDQAYKKQPKSPDVLFNLAFAHQRLENRDDSVRFYRELIAVDPNHRQGVFNLAYAYLHSNVEEDWRRSVSLFERALEIDPDYTECLFHLASAHWKIGNGADAEQYDRAYLNQGTHEDLKQKAKARIAGTSG